MVFLGGWNIVDVTLNHILSCILAYCDRARWVKNQWYFDAGCSIFSIRYITYVLGVFYGRNMNVLEFIISTYKYIWTFARGGLEYPLKDLKYYRNASKLTQFVTKFWMKKEEAALQKKKISKIMRTLLEITYHSIDWSTQCSIYLVFFCSSETGIVCDRGVKIPTFSIFLFFMEFWQNEVRVGNRHAQS